MIHGIPKNFIMELTIKCSFETCNQMLVVVFVVVITDSVSVFISGTNQLNEHDELANFYSIEKKNTLFGLLCDSWCSVK